MKKASRIQDSRSRADQGAESSASVRKATTQPQLDLQRAVGNRLAVTLMGTDQAGRAVNRAPVHNVLQRELVRDRVFSDAEFTVNLQAPVAGSTEETHWKAIVAQLASVETTHKSLAIKQRVFERQNDLQSVGERRRLLNNLVTELEKVVGRLPKLIAAAQTFLEHQEAKTAGVGGAIKGLFKGKDKTGKSARISQVEALLFQARRRQAQMIEAADTHGAELRAVQKEANDAKREAMGQKSEAMNQARSGTFGLNKGTVKDASFGAGAMGSVSQVDYTDEKGQLFKGVFKAEPEQLSDNDGGMSALGTSKKAPNLTMRSVAASRINELLGMRVIPRTELAFHEQFGFGQVMALAGGKSPLTKVKVPIENADPQKIAQIEAVLKAEESRFGPQSKVISRQDATGETKHFIEENVSFETDWDNPILKRELTNLQMMDALIGNVDRHAENYFIDVDAFGNPIGVLGIDNDLTFARDKTDPTELAMNQGHMTGLPPAVDQATAEKFCAVTEDQVRGAVKGLLTAPEIQTLVGRLKVIQAKLLEKGPDGGYLIPRIGNDLAGARQWTELKDPDKVKGSYFSRERAWQQGGMKPQGRLLKPQHALLYKEDRMAEIAKKMAAANGAVQTV